MTALWAITRRELASFFHSVVAPVVLTGFLVSVGLFFTIYLFGYSEMSLTALQAPASGSYLNLAEGLFRPLVSITVFFLLFLLPALSMRLMAPDLRAGRRELVASWPVGDGTWILGKWLGGSLAALALIAAGAAYILAGWTFGHPEAGPAFTAVLGQALIASCLVAWGLLASCLVSHQIVAYFLAFMFSLTLFIIGTFDRLVGGAAGRLASELSLLTHFERFSRGVIALQDLLYFAGMTAIALAIAWAVHAGRRLAPGRRLGPWMPALLTIVVAVLVYLVGAQFPRSWDLTGNHRYSLAPQSLQVLDQLGDLLDGKGAGAAAAVAGGEGPTGADHVQVYAFYQKLDPARDETEALLTSCRQRSHRFRFEVIDPEVDLDLFRKYDLGSSRSVVVTVGDRFTTLMQPEESALLSAVYRLASGRLSRVMFLTGHGEHLLDNNERPGYVSCALALTDQGYDVQPLLLPGGARVPDACDVLVIAGPRLDPEPGETAAIDAFIARGGAVLAMVDPPTPAGWVTWLERWHLVPTGEVLIDAGRVAVEQGLGPRTVAIVDSYSHHAIVHSLHGLVTTFALAQPLMRTTANDSLLLGSPLLTTGETSWAESDPATLFTGRPEFDPQTDHRGPLPFGWVLESRHVAGTRPGRLVAIGNSEFLNNAMINRGANRDLLLNAVGWLAREDALIQVRGRDPLSQPVVLTARQKNVYACGALAGWPLLVGSLAVGLMLRSRRELKGRP